ncbi:hypothetical protein NDN08_006123 [Rhodosorus marinus]|uniref:Splicing factor U2AF subunit n=1 Tax=Rhodosorus marinus TaxID=101924 RepID=A0AAV8UMM0_9RHOD|nr:hypothetical protein NDN08_006123 [Rhodosorus marinus]
MGGQAEGHGNAEPAPNPAAAAQAVAAAVAPNAIVPPASVAQQMQAGELAATMAQPTYQATRHARRLYVGNLPADSTDADVSEFFNKSMTVAGGVESPGNPVLSVYLNLDKRFAFIELRTMAEAAAALQMDGVLFRGMSLRMRRPNDYNPIAFPPVEPPASFNPSLLGIVSTQVPDGPNKVFIGGIPYHLTEDQIKELLQAYGPLGAFNLIKDANTGLSKGYAFFEYQDPTIIDVACQGLNGMQINDKTLTVRRANQQGGSSQKTGQMGAGGLGQIQMPTRVLELDNMLTEEDLQNEEEYEDICEDIKEECSKYGNLEEVLIPRKGQADASEAKGVGKVYLKYSKPEETSRAYASMVGRKFGGRPVVAKYLDEDAFTKREFS